MPERVWRLGAVLSGAAALVYLLFLSWGLWLVITGEWQARTQRPDAPLPAEVVDVLIGLLLLALVATTLACAWCAAQWWHGHGRQARIGSLTCLVVGFLLFPLSGGASVLLTLPALTLLFWKRTIPE